MAKKSPSQQSIDRVESMVGGVSIAALRNWLRSLDLAHSATSRIEISKRIASLIDNGKLTIEELNAALIGIEESSGKRVMFFELDAVSSKHTGSWLIKHLARLKIDVSDKPSFAGKSPRSMSLIYANVDGTKFVSSGPKSIIRHQLI